MNDVTMNLPSDPPLLHGLRQVDGVKLSVAIWFCVAAIGQWLFLAYILLALYPPLAQQGLHGLEALDMPNGFREGDTVGNLAAASHVLLAAVIIGGGPLQLVPGLRKRFPVFHRYLGRMYLITAVTTAIGGLWMIWTRGTVGGLLNHIGISIDAVLILVFAALALWNAIHRQIAVHRRWAMRLFLAASAVWFFRVGLMAWIMLTDGAGIDFDTFTGPAVVALGFAQYLLPLAMLEWYFRCQRVAGDLERSLFVGTLSGLTVYMGLGIFAATMGLWLPRIG